MKTEVKNICIDVGQCKVQEISTVWFRQQRVTILVTFLCDVWILMSEDLKQDWVEWISIHDMVIHKIKITVMIYMNIAI